MLVILMVAFMNFIATYVMQHGILRGKEQVALHIIYFRMRAVFTSLSWRVIFRNTSECRCDILLGKKKKKR